MAQSSACTGVAARLFPAACAVFMALNARADAPVRRLASEPRGFTVAFGNTIRTTYADGRQQRIWFHPDGRWEAIGRRGNPTAGKWSLKDDKVCLKVGRSPLRYCTVFPANAGIGAVWTGYDWGGEPIRLTVVKGIERPRAAATACPSLQSHSTSTRC